MVVALYPGSFDPITKGHEDILLRAASLFERVVLAVAGNRSKHPVYGTAQRVALAKQSVEALGLTNVAVEELDGLTVSFAQAQGASVIIRGLRAVSDFDYECSLSQMNRSLDASITTVFLMAGLDYQFLSSRMVREVASLGGDVSSLVSPHVFAALHAPPSLSSS
jgi:pantetheine-phosphate adenylyltransferase